MDTNQVIENSEEVIEKTAEQLADAGWTGKGIAGVFGVGVLAGIALAKYVIAPLHKAWKNRLPKEVEVKAKKEKPTVEEKTETESCDKDNSEK